jgi:hypothetical protein
LIKSEIVSIVNLIEKFKSIPAIVNSLSDCFTLMIESLKDDLWCYIEAPYVDRIYRDAYYHFYSSKLDVYNRDCLRVSFFEQKIQNEMFYNHGGHETLKKSFVGFTVVRLMPNIQNPCRTALSPKAFKKHNFICELAPIKANVGGVKMEVKAFPFSSQDGECMTCAETAIWAVMEYYGNKYSELKLVLPSEIHKAFKRSTRVLPSEGLTMSEIAAALTNFGFGSYLYAKDDDSSPDAFHKNLIYYIESGIPVILGLQNSNKIGHSVVAIGHETVSASEMLRRINLKISTGEGNKIVDTAGIERNILLIDDNYPPYQLTTFDKPCSYYTEDIFLKCTIEHFVVPLNHRIYLDARKASKLLTKVLEHQIIGWKKRSLHKDKAVIKRIFLTSSNSYKSNILQSDMNIKLKELIQALLLPKFIWIAELSMPDIYLENKACGLILLDATGSDTLKSIKMVLYPGYIRSFEGRLEIPYDFGNFEIYINNLKGA